MKLQKLFFVLLIQLSLFLFTFNFQTSINALTVAPPPQEIRNDIPDVKNQNVAPASDSSQGTQTGVGVMTIGGPVAPGGQKQSPFAYLTGTSGSDVDLKSAAFTLSHVDLMLPGKNGLNVVISRTYNSKSFNSSPSFKSQSMDEWGSWMGKGWNMSVGGKLVVIKRKGYDAKADTAMVTLPEGQMQFVDAEHDGTFVDAKKGSFYKLFLYQNYYMVLSPNGKKYYFTKMYYEQNLYWVDRTSGGGLQQAGAFPADVYHHPTIAVDDNFYQKVSDPANFMSNMHNQGGQGIPMNLEPNPILINSGQKTSYSFITRAEGYFLTKIEDEYGNSVRYEYEQYGNPEKGNSQEVKYQTFNFEECWMEWGQKKCKDNWQTVQIANLWKNHTWTPYRPVKAVDTFGRSVYFSYQPSGSQITKVSYVNTNGKLVSYEYGYDAHSNLVEVKPPIGKSLTYGYQYVKQDSLVGKTDYNHEGYLLTRINNPTGSFLQIQYQWFDAGAGNSLNEEQRAANSSYQAFKLTQSNGMAMTYQFSAALDIGSSLKPEYSGYFDERLRNYFHYKQVKVTDINGQSAVTDFAAGNIVKTVSALGYVNQYFYDSAGRLVKTSTARGGPEMITEYLDFDAYLYPQTVMYLGNTAGVNDDVKQVQLYTHIDTAVDGFIQGLPASNASWRAANPDAPIPEYPGISVPLYRLGLMRESYKHLKTKPNDKRAWQINEFNAYGQTIKQTQKYSGGAFEKTYQYNPRGLLVSQTDVLGITTHYEYEDDYYLTAQWYASEGKTYRTETEYYKTFGRIKSQKGINGAITRFVYDDLDRMVAQTDAVGRTLRIEFDEAKNQTRLIDHKNNISVVQYNDLGQLVEEIAPDGTSRKYEYDVMGRKTLETGTNGFQYAYTYDVSGRILKTTAQDGGQTSNLYDDKNIKVTKIDPNGNAFVYTSDIYGHITKIEQPNGGITTHQYDAYGNLIETRDPRGLVTKYEYDDLSRPVKTVFSDGQTEEFFYNALGQQTKKIDRKGMVIESTYDALGRTVQVKSGNTLYQTVYDGSSPLSLGQVVRKVYPGGAIEYQYDILGQVTQEKKWIGTIQSVTSYEYNDLNLLSAVTYPDGRRLYYEYSNDAKLKQVFFDTAQGKKKFGQYFYNPDGSVKALLYENGVNTNYGYDLRGRLVKIITKDLSGRELYSQEYSYDGNNNRKTLTYNDTLQKNPKTIRYEYDVLDELTAMVYPDGKRTEYKYDLNGNRTEFKHAMSGTIRYNYANNSDRLISYVDSDGLKMEMEYDELGNMTKRTASKNGNVLKTLILNWDEIGNMNQSEYLNGAVNTFGYDVFRQKTFKASGQGMTVFNYLGKGMVSVEADVQGVEKTDYIYGMGHTPIARIDVVNGVETVTYLLQDALGSVVQTTDERGEVLQHYYYDPFGNSDLEVGESRNQLKWTGHLAEDDLDLYYFGARWYDPVLGRFISEDPVPGQLANPLSYNRYIYALNNPLKYVDLFGEFWQIIGAILGGLLGAAITGAIYAGIVMAIAGGITALMNGTNILEGMYRGLSNGVVMGFGAGLISGGVSLIGGLGGLFATGASVYEFVQTAVNIIGVVQGVLSGDAISTIMFMLGQAGVFDGINQFAGSVGGAIGGTIAGFGTDLSRDTAINSDLSSPSAPMQGVSLTKPGIDINSDTPIPNATGTFEDNGWVRNALSNGVSIANRQALSKIVGMKDIGLKAGIQWGLENLIPAGRVLTVTKFAVKAGFNYTTVRRWINNASDCYDILTGKNHNYLQIP